MSIRYQFLAIDHLDITQVSSLQMAVLTISFVKFEIYQSLLLQNYYTKTGINSRQHFKMCSYIWMPLKMFEIQALKHFSSKHICLFNMQNNILYTWPQRAFISFWRFWIVFHLFVPFFHFFFCYTKIFSSVLFGSIEIFRGYECVRLIGSKES